VCYYQAVDRFKKKAVGKVTQNQKTVQCKILTGSGRNVEDSSGYMVQCELLKDSGQTVECDVVAGSGQTVEDSMDIVTQEQHTLRCELLKIFDRLYSVKHIVWYCEAVDRI